MEQILENGTPLLASGGQVRLIGHSFLEVSCQNATVVI